MTAAPRPRRRARPRCAPRVDLQRASQDAVDTFFVSLPALDVFAVPAHALLTTHGAVATDTAFIAEQRAAA